MKSDVERPSTLSRGRSGPLSSLMTDPFSMLAAMRQEMDRLFNFGPTTLSRSSLWAPQIETYEKDGKVHVCADLPGLTKDDVHIDIHDDILMIEGERKQQRHDEARGWSERSYGRFVRSIQLPDGVNPENAKATFKDGVLDIELDAPKVEEKKSKRIEIQ